MSIEQVAETLMHLMHELEAVNSRAEDIRVQYIAISERQGHLREAIASLQKLLDMPAGRQQSIDVREIHPGDVIGLSIDDDDAPPQLVRYLPRGGGKRLRSTQMVIDLMDEIGGPISRDEFRDVFFHRFGYDLLARYWERPDNAFGNAFARAVQEDQILEVSVGGDGTVYFASRLVEDHLRHPMSAEEAINRVG